MFNEHWTSLSVCDKDQTYKSWLVGFDLYNILSCMIWKAGWWRKINVTRTLQHFLNVLSKLSITQSEKNVSESKILSSLPHCWRKTFFRRPSSSATHGQWRWTVWADPRAGSGSSWRWSCSADPPDQRPTLAPSWSRWTGRCPSGWSNEVANFGCVRLKNDKIKNC